MARRESGRTAPSTGHLRVLFVHAYPHSVAGAQRVTLQIMAALSDRGDDAALVTVDDGPFPQRLRETGLDVRVLRAPSVWRRYGGTILRRSTTAVALLTLPAYWLRLVAAIRRWRPSVVHINDHRAMLLAGPAARLAGAPIVWHLHSALPSTAINRLGGRLASAVVVNSAATADAMPILERRFPEKLSVIHNALPAGVRRRATSTAEPPARDPHLVVCGARIHPVKGLDVLLRATAEVHRVVPAVRVEVAGNVQDGYEAHAEELLQLRGELGLDAVVTFLGAVEDPLAAWARAGLYVQPSRFETFGLAALEAMALGAPVVASRVGGLPEVVEDGRSGLLVPPEDPPALASAMLRVLTDPALAGQLAAEGRRRATEDFGEDRMMTSLTAVYRAADVRR